MALVVGGLWRLVVWDDWSQMLEDWLADWLFGRLRLLLGIGEDAKTQERDFIYMYRTVVDGGIYWEDDLHFGLSMLTLVRELHISYDVSTERLRTFFRVVLERIRTGDVDRGHNSASKPLLHDATDQSRRALYARVFGSSLPLKQ